MNPARRSIFLAAIVVATVILGVLFFVINDRRVLQELLAQNTIEREAYVDGILKMKKDALSKALEDYTTWEEMARFVASPTREWAKNNIDSILATYKAQGYWVYDVKGRLVSSLSRNGDNEILNQAFPAPLPRLDGSVILPRQFFVATAAEVMEVYLASIHLTADTTRSGPVMGYFIFTRVLDDTYLQEIGALTHCTVELLNHGVQQPLTAEYHDGELAIRRLIANHQGQPLRVLQARTTLSEIMRLQEHNRLHGLFGLAFILFFLGALTQLVRYQRTLRRANKNLDEAQQLAKMGSWEREIGNGTGYWSDNSFRLFGLKPRRSAPSVTELYALIHEDDRQRVQEHLQAAMTAGHEYEVEFRLAHDAEQRVFRSIGTALRDETGKPVRLVGSIQDITEKLQQELAKDQLLKQKEMFIARLSHDIKTPLTPLVALLPQIRRKITDERLAGMLDLCLDSVNHMKALVVKTIKLARFSSPGQSQLTELTSLPLAEVVHDYLRKRADLLERAHMQTEVVIDPTVTVKADQLELEEVFYNLISNAVKYSPPGSHIWITATLEAEQVTVSLRDNGSGLTPDELTHIFDEFFKADQSRHELDSSGLGLSICKRIIENHGGRIWAESAGKGCGTVICFTIAAGGKP